MSKDILKYWEAQLVDVPSTSVPAMIAYLRGGESITIKSLAASGKAHYIGSSKDMATIRSYTLDTGETMTLTLPASFGTNNRVEIWALAETAGEDICYFKLINLYPSTEAST